LDPSPQTFLGIYSQNCPEWILTEQGAYCFSMVIVPLYDTLGPDACAYIIKQGIYTLDLLFLTFFRTQLIIQS
jgi:long-chain acyl-CoA synthetase